MGHVCKLAANVEATGATYLMVEALDGRSLPVPETIDELLERHSATLGSCDGVRLATSVHRASSSPWSNPPGLCTGQASDANHRPYSSFLDLLLPVRGKAPLDATPAAICDSWN